jgi:hypothetical protein
LILKILDTKDEIKLKECGNEVSTKLLIYLAIIVATGPESILASADVIDRSQRC